MTLGGWWAPSTVCWAPWQASLSGAFPGAQFNCVHGQLLLQAVKMKKQTNKPSKPTRTTKQKQNPKIKKGKKPKKAKNTATPNF